MKTTTKETVTADQITALRDEAKMAGDEVMADICEIALASEDSDGTGTALGKPLTIADARAACVAAINDAEAQS